MSDPFKSTQAARNLDQHNSKKYAAKWRNGCGVSIVNQQNVKMILPSPLAMTQVNTNFN